MTNMTKGILFAALMLGVALARQRGWVAEDFSRTMLIVLPVLAVTSFAGRKPCEGCAS